MPRLRRQLVRLASRRSALMSLIVGQFSQSQLLLPPSRTLAHPDFSFVGILESPSAREDYIGYLQRLESRLRVHLVKGPKLTTLSGQRVGWNCEGELVVPAPQGRGSVGVQFEEYRIRVDLLPVQLEDGTIRVDIET